MKLDHLKVLIFIKNEIMTWQNCSNQVLCPFRYLKNEDFCNFGSLKIEILCISNFCQSNLAKKNIDKHNRWICVNVNIFHKSSEVIVF